MKMIQLTQGFSAKVDDDDFEYLSQYKWYYNDGYALRTESGKRVRMHRIITNAPTGMDVDHIDHDTLNNQKYNLRVCTRSENKRNSKKTKGNSKFKGVSLLVRTIKGVTYKYYRSRIWVDMNKSIEKVFPYTTDGEIEAARDYDEKAKKYFGDFAKINGL